MTFGYLPERFDCFVTPIWRFASDGSIDNRALEAAIHHEREQDPIGTEVSNIGGWQSHMTLHRAAPFAPLVEYSLEKAVHVCSDWGLDFHGYRLAMNTCWANVNRGRDVNEVHHHWGFTLQNFNLLSGVYYVKCNERSGAIKFVDERPSSKFVLERSFPFVKPDSRFLGDQFSIRPSEGDLVMFPAWLDHKVTASADGEERISVAFNLSLPQELCEKVRAARGPAGPPPSPTVF